MSAPMFRLAGSGWYETDFKSDKESKRNLAGKDDGPPAESPSSATTGDKATKADTADKKVESKPEPTSTKQSVAVKKPAAKQAARSRPAAKKSAPKKAARKR
jgi:hypothetical protein